MIIFSKKNKSFFKDHLFSIFYLVIFLLGLFLRLYAIDDRPLHHDESLHGVYSLYNLFNSKFNFYKYNPLLHGPFLYNTLAWTFWLFDISKWSLRLPAALIGSALICLPLVFKSQLRKSTLIVAALFISIGPTFIYWSRFMRHDSFVLLSLFILIYSIFLVTKPLPKSLLIGLSLAINFSTKENFFIHILLLSVLLFYENLVLKFNKNDQIKSLLQSLVLFLKNNPLSSLSGFLFFLFIGSYYYTSAYIYPEGFLDGLYRKSLSYWIHQHHIERISGPFIYSFFINLFYESWWGIFVLLHLILFYKKRNKIFFLIFMTSFLPGLIFRYSSISLIANAFLLKFLKIKINLDFFLFFPLIHHSLMATTIYLRESKRSQAYSLFFFTATLFTYSFIGEKVPWLAIYPLFAGLIFFSFDFNHFTHKGFGILILILIPKLLFNTVWLNFSHSHHSQNLLSQVHTTKNFENNLKMIRSEMNLFKNGAGATFLAKDGHTWPTSWYLFNRKEYQFNYLKHELKNFKYILTTPQDIDIFKDIKQTHKYKDITYRSWFIFDYEHSTALDFFAYWWSFKTKQPVSTSKLRLFYRN